MKRRLWNDEEDEKSGAGTQPVFEELIRQAASGAVLYSDDISVKILGVLDHERVVEDPKWPGRTGVFTTGTFPHKKAAKSPCSFPAANTLEKTSPMCWPSGPPNYPGRN